MQTLYIVFSAVLPGRATTADSSSMWSRECSCRLLLCSADVCRTSLSRLRAQHQAPRHHTWPGAARCVGKTDPPRPVKRGDSDSRKDHGQTKIPIPKLFSKCELMDMTLCILCSLYIYL